MIWGKALTKILLFKVYQKRINVFERDPESGIKLNSRGATIIQYVLLRVLIKSLSKEKENDFQRIPKSAIKLFNIKISHVLKSTNEYYWES